jgi:hypothetical protein
MVNSAASQRRRLKVTNREEGDEEDMGWRIYRVELLSRSPHKGRGRLV